MPIPGRRFRSGLLAALALCGLAAAAMGQESVTFSNVDSWGAFGQPTNVIKTHTFTGGYAVKTIHVSGTVHPTPIVACTTYYDDLYIVITSPAGDEYDFTPSPTPFTGPMCASTTMTDVVFTVSPITPAANTAGVWTFQFAEAYVDNGPDPSGPGDGPDATWDTVTITIEPPVLSLASGSSIVPANVPQGESTTVLAQVALQPGTAAIDSVTLDASTVDAGLQTLVDDGTSGDVTAHNNTYSRSFTIPGTVPSGTYALPYTAHDVSGATVTGSFTLTIAGPPANDHCSNPTPLFVGIPVNFDTTYADTDGPNVGLCAGYPVGFTLSVHNDVWFLFVPPYSGPFKFRGLPYSGTNSNNWILSMYQGSDCSATAAGTWQPSPGQNAFDIDATCHTGQYGAVFSQGTGSLIAPNLIGGQPYLIRLGSTQTGTGAQMQGQIQAYAMILSPPVQHPTLGLEYVLMDNMNWHFAELAAQNLGGHLPSLHSAADATFLINNLWAPYTSGPGFGVIMWDGLNAPVDSNHATWQWTDGTPVDYDAFAPDPASGHKFYGAFYNSGAWTSRDLDTDPNTTLPQELSIAQILASGVCCNAGACTFIFRTQNDACTSAGGAVGSGTTCSPNPCTAGVCCRGATCNASISQANCTATAPTGAAYITSSGSSCNSGGSTVSPCCYPDYNKSGAITVGDIFDFLNAWFAGSLAAHVGGDGDTGTLAVADIFNFLNAWFAGGC
jgi:hypothetical protein